MVKLGNDFSQSSLRSRLLLSGLVQVPYREAIGLSNFLQLSGRFGQGLVKVALINRLHCGSQFVQLPMTLRFKLLNHLFLLVATVFGFLLELFNELTIISLDRFHLSSMVGSQLLRRLLPSGLLITNIGLQSLQLKLMLLLKVLNAIADGLSLLSSRIYILLKLSQL